MRLPRPRRTAKLGKGLKTTGIIFRRMARNRRTSTSSMPGGACTLRRRSGSRTVRFSVMYKRSATETKEIESGHSIGHAVIFTTTTTTSYCVYLLTVYLSMYFYSFIITADLWSTTTTKPRNVLRVLLDAQTPKREPPTANVSLQQ